MQFEVLDNLLGRIAVNLEWMLVAVGEKTKRRGYHATIDEHFDRCLVHHQAY